MTASHTSPTRSSKPPRACWCRRWPPFRHREGQPERRRAGAGGYALGCWLRDYAGQVWLFTREPAVDWTNNVSEQGAKAAKRHQAVSGYWHNQRTLARWCRTRSYLDSAAAHGLTALDAVTAALTGKPWLPLPAVPAAA